MKDFLTHIGHEFELPLSNPVLLFALLLLIILLAPFLLKKFNIPGIIGLIISGIIIGPNGLNIVENNSAVGLFSTIGLLYIMFIAGLELDIHEFRSNRNKSLTFGIFTFIIPLVIGYPVCHFLLGYDFHASLLTASMFSTHTLVAYPIVSRLGVSKNQAVAITVGGTILTDTAVLIMLAVITSSGEGNLNPAFWARLGISLVIFLFVVFVIITRITRWFFQKVESEKHAHYIFVLSVVFFSAFLAELSGLEPIIGAFAAGLALNPVIPHSSPLMNRIEFIGNSLFIPFFLISVGMIVDISVILDGPTSIIIAVVLTLVALTGKWIAAFFTQKLFSYSLAQRNIIFGLSSSHAAATIAVIMIGYKAGILDENILNGTILLILTTCVIASFITEKAAKKIILSEGKDILNEFEKNRHQNEHILLSVVNFSRIQKLIEFAILIKDRQSVNPISLVTVIPNDSHAERNIMTAKKELEKIKEIGFSSEIRINPHVTIDVNPTNGITRISRELMADIIILGWPRKAGILEKIIGERINSIINNLDKNLFVCHLEKSIVNHKRIVVITPPDAESENGFNTWLDKIIRLSKELSVNIIHYGEIKTYNAIQEFLNRRGINISMNHKTFNEWKNILMLTTEIEEYDLIFLISARKNSISYLSEFDNIPSKLEKHFTANNKIIIYPRQEDFSTFIHDDLTTDSPSKGTKAFESLSKDLGNFSEKN